MKMFFITVICLSTLGVISAQPPDTEIYLFDVKKEKGGFILSNGTNITNRKGYDNQPSFHPGKPLLYYSSANDDGRTDIIEYNYQTHVTRKITNTSEREYSPTVTPDGNFISCIVQRDSGQQDLCKYPIDGGMPVVIIETLVVGYHAWADNDNVFLFVLGEPPTLQWYSVKEAKGLKVTSNIGRSLHRIPGSTSVSFVDKSSPDKWIIKKTTGHDTLQPIAETLPGREDITWLGKDVLLASDGSKIFMLLPGKDKTWKEVPFSSATSLKSVTRLAANSSGTKLAVVVSE